MQARKLSFPLEITVLKIVMFFNLVEQSPF